VVLLQRTASQSRRCTRRGWILNYRAIRGPCCSSALQPRCGCRRTRHRCVARRQFCGGSETSPTRQCSDRHRPPRDLRDRSFAWKLATFRTTHGHAAQRGYFLPRVAGPPEYLNLVSLEHLDHPFPRRRLKSPTIVWPGRATGRWPEFPERRWSEFSEPARATGLNPPSLKLRRARPATPCAQAQS
jgi:hypothetical protein